MKGFLSILKMCFFSARKLFVAGSSVVLLVSLDRGVHSRHLLIVNTSLTK